MAHRRLGRSLAGLLIACSLPLFAISLLIAAFASAGVAVSRPFHRRKPGDLSGLKRRWAMDEVRFVHAIKAYEKVIDAHTRERT